MKKRSDERMTPREEIKLEYLSLSDEEMEAVFNLMRRLWREIDS